MKKTFHLFFVLIAFTGMLFTGCETTTNDPTSDDPRDAFVGVWNFSETPLKSANLAYQVTISKNPNNSAQVFLLNFGNPGSSVEKIIGIATTNHIVVSSQPMTNDWVIEGNGQLSTSGTMNWTYSILAGGNHDSYEAVATKQ